MPAHVEQFDSVHNPVDEVYVEPSFIFDLIGVCSNPSDPRLSSSFNFYNKLSASKTRMWTTMLCLQEILWKTFRSKIYTEMQRLGVNTKVPYGRLKRNNPQQYTQAFNQCRPIIANTFRTFFAFDIDIRVPSEFAILANKKGKRIAQYARAILMKYNLEAADAFHIAMARCEGTRFIVSNDIGFQQVDTIAVYSFFSDRLKLKFKKT